jgi:multiple sugar transport system substrate-binding protein
MKRSLFAVSLIALVLLAVVFPVAAADRKVTIAMMTGPELEFLRELTKDFTAETGIAVEFIPLGREAYIEQVTTQLMGRSSTVDIVDIITSLAFAQFAAGGYLEPLGPWIEKSGLSLDHMTDALLDTVRYDGELYGVPTDGATMFLVYRKDLVQDPPDTWDEFIEEGKKWTQKHNPDSPVKYGIVIQGRPIAIPVDFYHWLWSYGGDILDAEGNVVLDSPQAIAALEDYVSLLHVYGIVPPDASSYEWAEINAAFQESVAAMSVQWNSGAVVCQDPAQSPKVYDKIGATLIPGKKQDDGTILRTPYVQSWALTINAYSKRKEEAFELIKWFSRPETLKKYALMGGTPACEEALTDPEVLAKFPLNDLLMDTFAVGKTNPAVPSYNVMRDVISTALSEALAGDRTPSEALKWAADEIRAVVGQ